MVHRRSELTLRWQRELDEQRECINQQQCEIVDLRLLIEGKDRLIQELENKLETARSLGGDKEADLAKERALNRKE